MALTVSAPWTLPSDIGTLRPVAGQEHAVDRSGLSRALPWCEQATSAYETCRRRSHRWSAPRVMGLLGHTANIAQRAFLVLPKRDDRISSRTLYWPKKLSQYVAQNGSSLSSANVPKPSAAVVR
jgi:hypothetical protein